MGSVLRMGRPQNRNMGRKFLVLYHGSRFKHFKTFYYSRHSLKGIVLDLLHSYFPGAPCYERFIALTKRVFVLLALFLISRRGQKPGIYYIDGTRLSQSPDYQTQSFRRSGGAGKNHHGLVLRLQAASGVQPPARDCCPQAHSRPSSLPAKLTSGQAHFWPSSLLAMSAIRLPGPR